VRGKTGKSSKNNHLQSMAEAAAAATAAADTESNGQHFPSQGEMRKHGFIQDRMWMLVQWKECFVGKDIVRFMVQNGLADDATAAVAMGQKLLQEGKIYYAGVKYLPKLNNFKNAYLFYRWAGSEYWLTDDYLKGDKKGKSLRIENYQVPEGAKAIQLFDASDDFVPTEVEIASIFAERNTVVFCVRRPG